MVRRNPYYTQLHAQYVFAEVAQRKERYEQEHPQEKLISLGIGDATAPVPSTVCQALQEASRQIGTEEGFSGYDSPQGDINLRKKIAQALYHNRISADEIFLSDGSKCDIGRLQVLFGPHARIAVQDPAYPAYVYSSVVTGKTSGYSPLSQQYEGLVYMPCRPENHFFPDVSTLPPVDILYFCSPNNPTGEVATRDQLKSLVHFAKEKGCLIVFDSAYAGFIHDPQLPRSIFEIEGAEEVAIETGSFSKTISYTGIRLGWTIVPKALRYETGESIRDDWYRTLSILFNGSSVLSRAGALAALSEKGIQETKILTQGYLKNVHILKNTLEQQGLQCFGGSHAPYLWVRFPQRKSWDVFNELLHQCQLITTPGVAFGPEGEGFVRFSAFAKEEDIREAANRLQKFNLKTSHKTPSSLGESVIFKT